MNRARKSSNAGPPTDGGNILFTLGLVSVVALLIVGWVMTQQGPNSHGDPGEELTKIQINPTPIKTITKPSEPTVEELRAFYDKRLKAQKVSDNQKLEKTKRQHDLQIRNLLTRPQTFELEDKSLRGS